jgi:hypothetical protein
MDGMMRPVFYVGNHFREYSKCCFELFIYLWYLIFQSWDCWRGKNDSITFCNAWVYALYDAKGKVSALFEKFSLKHQKKRQYYIIRLGAPAMQMFFEGFVHWSSFFRVS